MSLVSGFLSSDWRAFLICGSSGTGKTTLAHRLAGHFECSVLMADDIRLAVQRVTRPQTHWMLHEHCDPDLKAVADVVSSALYPIILNHLAQPPAGRIIIEGDAILPSAVHASARGISGILLIEEDSEVLRQNMLTRKRGPFNDMYWDKAKQQQLVEKSLDFQQWLKIQAAKHSLPIIAARPHDTIFERLLAQSV